MLDSSWSSILANVEAIAAALKYHLFLPFFVLSQFSLLQAMIYHKFLFLLEILLSPSPPKILSRIQSSRLYRQKAANKAPTNNTNTTRTSSSSPVDNSSNHSGGSFESAATQSSTTDKVINRYYKRAWDTIETPPPPKRLSQATAAGAAGPPHAATASATAAAALDRIAPSLGARMVSNANRISSCKNRKEPLDRHAGPGAATSSFRARLDPLSEGDRDASEMVVSSYTKPEKRHHHHHHHHRHKHRRGEHDEGGHHHHR